MIKFFRSIRKKLLAEGKTTNYLKYAIGEIVLVVIGILIALQINNWNQNRKIRHTELKLLYELKEDLQETKIDLLSDIEKAKNILLITDSIYQKINAKDLDKPIEISINYISETSMLFPKLSAYEALQSEGITIVSNDLLRKKITDFYQLHLSRIRYVESISENLNTNKLKPYLDQRSIPNNNCNNCRSLFELYSTDETIRLNTYIVNETDIKFKHIIKEKFGVFRALNNLYTSLAESIEDLINEIDTEIAKQ